MSGELQRGLSSTTSDPTAAPPVASTGNPLSRVVSPEGPPPALEPHAVQPAAKVGGTVGGSSLYEVATPEGPPPPLGGTGAGGHEGGEEDDGEPRAAWGSRTEFILMTVGYAVGLGNVWRFPYLCYQNGGGAFLIPYVVCLFLLGMPLMLLELAIGQIFRKGPFHSLQKVDPRLAGVGWAALICAVLVASYYNMVIAWALYYFFSSLASPLPWDHSVAVGQSGGHQNSTYFWKHNALGMSDTSAADGHSPDRFDIGGINWHMLLMLALVCVMCWGAVLRGVETSGKAVYVTSTAPYFFLTILVVRGVTLDGASDGIQFYLFGEVDESGVHRLSFDKLASIEVWQTAASQIFYSLGVGFGSLIAFGSYNPKDEDIVLDAVLVPLINSATSIYAGFAIFSLLGHMAHEQGTTVSQVAGDGGTGLAFIVYPEGLAQLPGATFISAAFFLMLFFLGFGSQFPTLEVPITMLKDSGVEVKQEVMTGLICLALFVSGIIMATDAGKFWVDLFDSYCALVALHVICVFEVVAMAWVYGAERLAAEIHDMTGRKVPRVVVFLWRWFIPPVLSFLILSGLTKHLAKDFDAVHSGEMSVLVFVVAWALALAAPTAVFVFLLRPCSQYPAALLPPPWSTAESDGATAPTAEVVDPAVQMAAPPGQPPPPPQTYGSLSWLACCVCLPVGLFAVEESQRAQRLLSQPQPQPAASRRAAGWAARLSYISFAAAAVFYMAYFDLIGTSLGGGSDGPIFSAGGCTPPSAADARGFDLGGVTQTWSGGAYDADPSGQPIAVDIGGLRCATNFTAAHGSGGQPSVHVCYSPSGDAAAGTAASSGGGGGYVCELAGQGAPVQVGAQATACWFAVAGCVPVGGHRRLDED